MNESNHSPMKRQLDAFLEKRHPPKTFCPSEVVRALSPAELHAENVDEWRELMPRIRETIWALRANGQLEVLQKGDVLGDHVTLDNLKGPIRVRRTEQEKEGERETNN